MNKLKLLKANACITLFALLLLCGCADLARQGAIGLAYDNFEDGDYEEALKYASQAEMHPESPYEKKAEITYIRALTLEKMGRDIEAQGLFKYLYEKFGDTQYGFIAKEKIKK